MTDYEVYKAFMETKGFDFDDRFDPPQYVPVESLVEEILRSPDGQARQQELEIQQQRQHGVSTPAGSIALSAAAAHDFFALQWGDTPFAD